MNTLEFIYKLLYLISLDSIFGFTLYLIWRFIDFKWFSQLEITILKNENEHLKRQIEKLDKTSFWES